MIRFITVLVLSTCFTITLMANEMPWATKFVPANPNNPNDHAIIKSNFPSNAPTSDSGVAILNFLVNDDYSGVSFFIDSGPITGCPTISKGISVAANRFGLLIYAKGSLTVPSGCQGQKTTFAYFSVSSLSVGYHNIICSWATLSNTYKCVVDGNSINEIITNYNGNPEAINLVSSSVYISANTSTTDIGFFTGFTDPLNIIDAVYDIETGYVRRNASTGNYIISGQRPLIWLSGPPNKLVLNEAAGDFGWPAIYNGNTNTDFSIYSGSISVADTDPFEPGSGE